MELNEDASADLTFTQIASQAFGFFIAGFETSSILMTYALYELSINESIQKKAREEIKSCLHKHGDFNYDCVSDMTYMYQILQGELIFEKV